MRGVTTTLEDVQRDLWLIAQETVLIGHSLENDLRRMRIMPRGGVDTVAKFRVPAPARAAVPKQALGADGEALRGASGGHARFRGGRARATAELALLKFTNRWCSTPARGRGREPLRACAAAGRGARLTEAHPLHRRAPARPTRAARDEDVSVRPADAHVAAELVKEIRIRRGTVDRATDAVGRGGGRGRSRRTAGGGPRRGARVCVCAPSRVLRAPGRRQAVGGGHGRAPGVDAGGGGGAEYRALKQAREQKREAPKMNASASSDAARLWHRTPTIVTTKSRRAWCATRLCWT